MEMRNILLMLWVLLFVTRLSGQRANIWHFGFKSGIEFIDTTIRPVRGGQTGVDEGTSSISDDSGKLVLYTDGMTLWRGDHSILDSGFNGTRTSTQSGLLVKKPGTDSMYYLFTAGTYVSNIDFFYSIIDMKFNNGKGKVIQKNVSLFKNSAEKVAAFHNKLNDAVIIAAYQEGVDSIRFYKLDKNGITHINSIYPHPARKINLSVGEIKFSRSGAFLAIGGYPGSLILIELNPNTLLIKRKSVIYGYSSYSFCFSNNEKYLYTSEFLREGLFPVDQGSNVYQLDVDSILSASDSVYRPGEHLLYSKIGWYGFQIGENGRIYFCTLGHDKLGEIEFPNREAPNCNLKENAFNMFGGPAGLVLTNYVAGITFRPFLIPDTVCLREQADIRIYGLDADSVYWTIDQQSPQVTYTDDLNFIAGDTGIRTIQAIAYSGRLIDTIRGFIYVYAASRLELTDSILCTGDTFSIDLGGKGHSWYLWNNVETNSFYQSAKTEVVQVKYGNQHCWFADTFFIQFAPKPTVYIGPDTSFCDLVDYLINPVTNASYFKWSTGDTSKSLHVNRSGNYELFVANKLNCRNADTVQIGQVSSPFVHLPNDTLLCGTSFELDAGNPGASYQWNTGDTSQQVRIDNSGMYRVIVSNQICQSEDSIRIELIPEDSCHSWIFIPNAFTPNGDGTNDLFEIKYFGIAEYSIVIYDRWGEEIFLSDRPGEAWDGTFKGVPVPDGVYMYRIHVLLEDIFGVQLKNYSGLVHVLQ